MAKRTQEKIINALKTIQSAVTLSVLNQHWRCGDETQWYVLFDLCNKLYRQGHSPSHIIL